LKNKTFRLKFPENISRAEAGKLAAGLRQEILLSSSDVSVDIERDDPSHMDFGTTLVLVLGAPAIVAVAKGIANYLSRYGSRIIIEADGKIVAEGISGKDLALIQEALAKS